MPFRDQMSPHALRQAARRTVPIDLIEEAFLDADDERPSEDEPRRVIRVKFLPDGRSLEVVVENDAYTIVTVWIKRGDAR